MRRLVLGCSVLCLMAGCLQAQSFATHACNGDEGNTNNNSWFGGGASVCEVRATTLPLVNGQVRVAGKNGGIEVMGEDRQDVALEARVMARASSREEAASIVREVKIATNGTIEAQGPSISGWSRRSWYVNYRLRVPRHVAADLRTQNGGISISDIDGSVQAETTNGGLTLRDLAGTVRATTVNGGVDVTLKGDRWKGSGLEARSTNGGVDLKVPNGYSAHLLASTTNGGVKFGFPVTLTGDIRNHIDTTLGQGGPTVQVETTNGGVAIARE